MSGRSQCHTSAHEHWRWPQPIPNEGERCQAPYCRTRFAAPAVVVEQLGAHPEDPRTVREVVEDARVFLELLALHCAVELGRRGMEGGMSVQEAHIERERICRLYRASRPAGRGRDPLPVALDLSGAARLAV